MSPPRAEVKAEKASPSPGILMVTDMSGSYTFIEDKLTNRNFSVSSATGGVSSGSCTVD